MANTMNQWLDLGYSVSVGIAAITYSAPCVTHNPKFAVMPI